MNQTIEVFDLGIEHFAAAERLIARYSFSHRLRTLDAPQLAVALDLRSQDEFNYFIVADKALFDVGRLDGLAVLNPEEPE